MDLYADMCNLYIVGGSILKYIDVDVLSGNYL
jgi:hypothetical protein